MVLCWDKSGAYIKKVTSGGADYVRLNGKNAFS